MDFNIDTWSIAKLQDVFEIEEPLSIEIIGVKTKEYINRANNIYKDKERDIVIKFVNEAANKMYDFCNKKYALDIKENNIFNIKENNFDITNSDTLREQPKIETFNLNYKKGVLNPLKKQTRILNMNINSLFRKNYFKTEPCDFVYTFPSSVKNVVSMRVASFEFPNTIHTFNSKHITNELTIITYDNSGGISTNMKENVITIPDGMYALDQLVEHFNKAIFNKRPELKRVAMLYNDKQASIQFVRNKDPTNNGDSNPNHLFDIDFRISSNKNRPIQLNLGWILGYRKPYYKFSEDYTTLTNTDIDSYEGYNPEAPVNILGTPYFLLHINDFNNNTSPVYETLFQEGLITSTHVMDKIPNTGSKTIIQTNLGHNIDKVRRYYGPVDIKKLEIKLLDQYGRVIDLQKADFSFTLQCEILYYL